MEEERLERFLLTNPGLYSCYMEIWQTHDPKRDMLDIHYEHHSLGFYNTT